MWQAQEPRTAPDPKAHDNHCSKCATGTDPVMVNLFGHMLARKPKFWDLAVPEWAELAEEVAMVQSSVSGDECTFSTINLQTGGLRGRLAQNLKIPVRFAEQSAITLSDFPLLDAVAVGLLALDCMGVKNAQPIAAIANKANKPRILNARNAARPLKWS